MIKKYKLNIVKEFEYPDHFNYSKDEINKICKEAENLKCKIITTEKDFLRIDKNKINIDQIKYIKSSFYNSVLLLFFFLYLESWVPKYHLI